MGMGVDIDMGIKTDKDTDVHENGQEHIWEKKSGIWLLRY